MIKTFSVFDTVKPVYFICRLFGTIPLKQSGNIYNPLKKNNLCTLYSVVLFCIAFTHMISGTFILNYSNFQKVVNNSTRSSKLIITMKIISPMLSSTLTLVSLFNSIVYVRKGLGNFFKSMQEIDLGLKQLVSINPRKSLYCSFILTVATFVVQVPLAIMYSFMLYSANSYNLNNLYWSICMAIFIVCGFTSEIQFVNWSYLLFIRFKTINHYLSTFLNSSMKVAWPPTVLKTNSCWHLGPKSNRLIRNRSQIHERYDKLTVEKLELVHNCHKNLCELLNDLNKMYQLFILFSLSTCFFKHLFYTYFLIFGYMTNAPSGQPFNETSFSKMYSVAWTYLFLIRFLVIVFSASYTSTEALAVKGIISSINSRFIDSALKEELLIFLNHISNKKVKFSACGFFNLNKKLITSALAAGATYLVILIQFHPQHDH